MEIHAFAAFAPKESLRPYTYSPPPLAPHEVLLKVSHCGLCHSDIHLIEDNWKRSRYPLVPGHEVIGTIVEKGKEVTLDKGERVGVSWIRSACLNCPTCLAGHTNICPQKTTTCNGYPGGFAQYMVADSRFVYPIPQELDSALAAPLLCAGATVYAPLRRLGVQAHHSVAILGIGGLGHLALQFAKAFGCEVTAISHSPSKKEEAKAFGADHFALFTEPPAPSQFDFIFSTVHADLHWNQVITWLKPLGTLCFLGKPEKEALIDIGLLLSPQKKITGSSNANRLLLSEMLRFSAQHRIAPQIELFPLSQVQQGIERVKANAARYRVVLECS